MPRHVDRLPSPLPPVARIAGAKWNGYAVDAFALEVLPPDPIPGPAPIAGDPLGRETCPWWLPATDDNLARLAEVASMFGAELDRPAPLEVGTPRPVVLVILRPPAEGRILLDDIDGTGTAKVLAGGGPRSPHRDMPRGCSFYGWRHVGTEARP